MSDHTVKPITARVVRTNKIVHNDLEIGKGTVEQRRAPNTYSEEKQIELVWIFRSIEEIKFLDTERYTRIALHTDGPLIEYWFDEACEFAADDNWYIKPHLNNHRGRWVRVEVVDERAREMIAELREQLCPSS